MSDVNIFPDSLSRNPEPGTRNLVVKVCGLTNLPDARAAVDAGADFLGLILVPESPRSVRIETAREIVGTLAGQAKTVGVFRNQPREFIAECIDSIGLDYVQPHGRETPDECRGFTVPVIKALEISPQLTPEIIASYQTVVEFLLFDRPKGQTDSNWLQQAIEFVRAQAKLPDYFFAGGLTAENVGPVIEQLKPFGIDVASGVEKAPGIKDEGKLRVFIQKSRFP